MDDSTGCIAEMKFVRIFKIRDKKIGEAMIRIPVNEKQSIRTVSESPVRPLYFLRRMAWNR